MTFKQKRKLLGMVLFSVVVIAILQCFYEISKLVVQSYIDHGMMGVFAFIGYGFTLYVMIYLVQKAWKWAKVKYTKFMEV